MDLFFPDFINDSLFWNGIWTENRIIWTDRYTKIHNLTISGGGFRSAAHYQREHIEFFFFFLNMRRFLAKKRRETAQRRFIWWKENTRVNFLNSVRMCVKLFSFVFFFFLAINSIREATSTRNITFFSAPYFSIFSYILVVSPSGHISIFNITNLLLKLPQKEQISEQLRTIFHDNSFIIDCFWFWLS